ncbi:hypothetical protein SOCEGT47_017970 [Sorangium cellulosum]|uniref:Uncharacterized protein n=1 Tax=Sorangium cellulosum TaxID=56 RepID=A0A4P2PXN6_SORCE|nr:DUF4419 domain-containing protein [Sorangium cellulosum]AUX21316.1 hypothetical protein SOCEGT47_017970 [Sorangium cellulosum]
MHVTPIAVADVEPATAPLPGFDGEAVVQSLLVARIEAAYRHRLPLVGRTDLHPLVQAACTAFTRRYPLVLSPDVVWFCVARGFTLHLAANVAERRRFVDEDRDFALLVERPDFTLGDVNPWPALFPDFSRQLSARVGKLWELVTAHFSTTGPVERVASELTVTTPLAPHFEGEPPPPGDATAGGRGIPRVYLLGTADDWRWMRQRATTLGAFGQERWIRALLPVLDEIAASAEGRPDTMFWRAFFRYDPPADELTGWIHVLFPYLRAWPNDYFAPNPYVEGWHDRWLTAEARGRALGGPGTPQGPGLSELPPGLTSAPLRFIDGAGREHPMDLISGLIGVTQAPHSLALLPEFVWAIAHQGPALPARRPAEAS